MGARGICIALAALAALCAVDCRTATDITVVVTTEVGCADLKGTSITVGALHEIETKPATSTSLYCDANGFVGALVVVPSGSRDDQVAIKVVSGVTTASDACAAPAYTGCIVARRALKYIPHAGLRVPITTRLDCKNVPCGEAETCSHGVCAPAKISDSNACARAAGCDDGALAVSACGDMSGYAAGSPFPMGAYCPARTGRVPFVGPRAAPLESWEVLLGVPVLARAPTISASGVVYAHTSDGMLHAIDGATGVEKWSFQGGASGASTPTLGASGAVYFAAGINAFALDAASGALHWKSRDAVSNLGSPVLGPDETVYMADDAGEVYAVSPADGSLKWRYRIGGLAGGGAPALRANILYVTSRSSLLVALDASSGALVWQATLPNLYDASPVLDENGTVYVGSQNGLVDAFDAKTGALRWEKPAGTGYTHVALGADDSLYVVTAHSLAGPSEPGRIFALSRATGDVRWETALASLGGGAAPTIDAAETVYVPAFSKGVIAVDGKSGAIRWNFYVPTYSSPSIGPDGTLFVNSTDSKLYALKERAAPGASPQGASCTADADCATGRCVAGKCCNTACTGPCAKCNTGGTCYPGTAPRANPSCAPYLCQVDNAACPTHCRDATDCAQGLMCVASKCQ